MRSAPIFPKNLHLRNTHSRFLTSLYNISPGTSGILITFSQSDAQEILQLNMLNPLPLSIICEHTEKYQLTD